MNDPAPSTSHMVPSAPSAGNDAKSVDLARVGMTVYVAATVVAGVAAAWVFLQTSFCLGQRVSQVELQQYASMHSGALHAWLAGIAVGWAAIPAGWSLWCVRAKVAWHRFALIAAGSLLVGLAAALTAVAQQSPLCISGF